MSCLVTVKMEEDVCCGRVIALDDLASSTHEEADSRIFVQKLMKRHGCGSYCHICHEILKLAWSWKNVNCVWSRRKCSRDSSARSGKQNRPRESHLTPIRSRIHWNSLEHSSGFTRHVVQCESLHVLQNTLSSNVSLYLIFVSRLRWMTKSEKKCS